MCIYIYTCVLCVCVRKCANLCEDAHVLMLADIGLSQFAALGAGGIKPPPQDTKCLNL